MNSMKWSFFLVLAMAFQMGAAQNALFIPFGQSITEVDSFLGSKDYLYEVYFPEDNILQAEVHPGRTMRYYFEDGYLFEIEEVRVIDNYKLKESIVKGCLDFLKGTEEKVKVLKTEGLDSHYAVAPEDRVMEFTVLETGKRKDRQVSITFTSTSRYYGPRMDTEAYVTQLEE